MVGLWWGWDKVCINGECCRRDARIPSLYKYNIHIEGQAISRQHCMLTNQVCRALCTSCSTSHQPKGSYGMCLAYHCLSSAVHGNGQQQQQQGWQCITLVHHFAVYQVLDLWQDVGDARNGAKNVSTNAPWSIICVPSLQNWKVGYCYISRVVLSSAKTSYWTEQKSCLGASGQEWILIELQVLRTA